MLSFASESYERHDFKPLLRYETTILTNISKTRLTMKLKTYD